MGKKRFGVILISAFLFTGVLHAEGEETLPNNGEPVCGTRSRFECALYPAISAGFIGFTFLSSLIGLEDYWLNVAVLTAAQVPAYFENPLHGLGLTLTFGGLLGADRLLEGVPEANLFQDFIYTGMLQTGMFSTYVAYRDLRANAMIDVYDDRWRDNFPEFYRVIVDSMFIFEAELDQEWKPYSFGELLLAPLEKKHYSDLIIAILPIAGFLKPLITQSHENAMWTTGESYIAGWKVPGYVSIPAMLVFFYFESTIIAIAEESHFRGFIYEDLASNDRLLAAKIVDPLYFAAIHIPQEIGMEYSPGQIVLDFAQRTLLTVYIDFLYDRGGLSHSVTAHMLIDFSQLFAMWLLTSGVPQTGLDSILSLVPPAGIMLRMPF